MSCYKITPNVILNKEVYIQLYLPPSDHGHRVLIKKEIFKENTIGVNCDYEIQKNKV